MFEVRRGIKWEALARLERSSIKKLIVGVLIKLIRALADNCEES